MLENVRFDIIKKYVDKLDGMGLLDMGAPKDEYDIESKMINERMTDETTPEEIAEIMLAVFSEMFGEAFDREEKIDTYVKTAKSIYAELSESAL